MGSSLSRLVFLTSKPHTFRAVIERRTSIGFCQKKGMFLFYWSVIFFRFQWNFLIKIKSWLAYGGL